MSPTESKKEALRLHREQRKMQSMRYRAIMGMIAVQLEALTRRPPTPNDVLDLLENLCIVGAAEELLDKVYELKSKYR